VNDALGVYVDNEEGKEAPKPDIANGDEVARPRAVISKKGSPSLAVGGSRWTRPNHVFLNGAFGKVNAEFEQFTSDSLRSPKAILRRHTPNECDHLVCDARYGRPWRPCLPAEEDTKPFTMPTQDRGRFDEQQSGLPFAKEPREQNQKAAFMSPKRGSLHRPRSNDELLTKERILGE
jgi:hypothetical protein